MNARYVCILLMFCFSYFPLASAQEEEPAAKPTPYNRLYWGSSMDGAIFSTALVQHTGRAEKLTTLRFSYIVNFGFNLNYDFNRHIGLMTGAGIKNIGFIEKFADSTVKRRVYALGVPLGVKIGNLHKRNFVFLGGGVDAPVNYREKGFIKRGDKEKFNEWFSERTPAFMPYVFAGVSASPGVTLKLQYYPGNFMNRDYTMPDPGGNDMLIRPYSSYERSNLLMLSIGVDLHYNKHNRHGDRKDQALKKM